MNKLTKKVLIYIPDDGYSHWQIEMDWDKVKPLVDDFMLISEEDMNKRLEEVMAYIDTV